MSKYSRSNIDAQVYENKDAPITQSVKGNKYSRSNIDGGIYGNDNQVTPIEPPVIEPLQTQTIDPNPMSNVFNKTMNKIEQDDSRSMFEPKPVFDPAGFPIDINRPIVMDEQGNAQTERGVTVDASELGYPFNPGQRFVNIPSVIDGVAMSGDAALALTKKKIQNRSIDASKFPTFNSIEEATTGSIERSKQIGELRKDDIKKATKQFKVDQEVKRLTDLYGKPTKDQGKLNKNPNQSFVGGSFNNFTLKTERGEVKIDNETAIKLIADSNISEGDDSNLANNALFRGFIRANQAMSLLAANLGMQDQSQAIKFIAELNRTSPNQPKEVSDALKQIVDAKGWKNVLSAIANNPSAVLSVVGESFPMSMSSLATFITGTAVTGNPLVGAAGGGIVTFGNIYSDTILEELQKAGVDMTNDEAIEAKLADPEFYARAKKSAIAYGMPIAVFDALSMGLAGKLVSPAIQAGASVPKIAGLSAVELAGQGLLGSAGEFGGQFTQAIFGLRDEINKGEIGLEFFAEIPLGAVETATNVASSVKSNQAESEFDSAFDQASQQNAQDTAINLLSPDNAQLSVVPENVEDIDFRPSKNESLAVETESSEVTQSENETTETPVVETPVVETPVVETPVVETPVVETPVVETPVVETPVVETPPIPKPRPETVKIDPAPKAVESTEVEELQTKDSSKQVNIIGDFTGKMEKVRTPGSEKEIDVAYLVVDANKLKKASGDFQPRDRDLKESEKLVIERAVDLDPKQLLEAPTTNTGAPIISNNGTIISGNGRVLSLEKAKADFPDQYNKYKKSLDEYTNESFSARTDEMPILVRVLSGDFTNQELIELADLSNRDPQASMNATEKAVRDAKAMGTDLIVQFKGGDINSLENKPFVNQFIQNVATKNEQGNMSRDNALTREGAQRIQNAILASAYEDTNALATMLDSTDDNIKAISNAMLSAAPKFAQLKSDISGGRVEAKYDITPQITDMAQRISTARRDGTAISDILNQGDMLAEIDPLVKMLIKGIYNEKLTRAKSQKFMTEFLNAYVEESSKKQTGGMFEDETTVGEVIELARSKADGQEDPTLFERGARSSSQSVIESRQQKQRADTKTSSTRPEKRNNQEEVLEDAAVEQDREIASRSDITEAIIVENQNSYKNQRVEKPGTLVDKLAERNKTALIFSAFEAAGFDPNIAKNFKIERQYRILQKMFVDQFGMKQVTKSKDKNSKDAVDQLLTGYHNLSALANFFNIPYKAIGLEGTLTFDMVENYGAYGSFNPNTKAITIPRRVNSFAHEWFHALDHYLVEKYGVAQDNLLSKNVRRDGKKAFVPDAPKNIQEAYANLVRAMFQDKASESQKLIEIDNEIARISKKKPEAKKIQELLKRKETILGGKASSRTVDKTQFRKDAEFFAPIYNQDVKYWASPHEMFARVGEAFTTYKMNLAGMDAGFLSKTNEGYLITLEQLGITKEGLQNQGKLNEVLDSRMALTFPKEQERIEIFGAMQNLIDAVSTDTILGKGSIGQKLSEMTRVDVRKLYEVPKDHAIGLLEEQRQVWRESKLFNERQKERQKQLDLGARDIGKIRNFYENVEDTFFSQFLYQKQGILKSIIKRYPRNREMQYLFQNLGTQAGGKLQSTATGGNFADATVRQARLFSFQLTSIMEQNKINEMSQDDRKLLRMILTSQDTMDSASPQVTKAAGQLRDLLNGIYEYIRNSGLDIGYAESGYLQRVLDMEMVNARSDKFKKQAAKAYEVIFVNEIGELNPLDEKQMLSVVRFIQESKLGIVENDPYKNFVQSKKFRAIVENMRTIRALKKKKNQTGLDDKEENQLAKAEDDLEKGMSEISEQYQKFYANMKFEYGDVSSTNWKNTLYEKQVGVTLDAPPTSNFTKKRTLPPETDALLDEFYVSDPIENIIGYIMSATRRAEFNRRFGLNKIPKRDMEGKVSKGRYNDYIDYLTQRGFNNAGVNPYDARIFADTVNLITGKSRTPGQDMLGSSFANHLHALTSVTLLVRAPIASLAEPFTAAITSESAVKGMSSFLTTMQELPQIRKLGGNAEDIRLRQQFARILGVIDDPEVGDIMTNRIGGSFANNQKLNRMMQQFFYKTKLTGLTNAQRRTASKIGFQFISEMAHEYKNPVNDRAKLKAKKVLNDFGVADSSMEQFAEYVTSFNDFKIGRSINPLRGFRKKSEIKGKTKLPANEDIMYDSGEYSDMGMQLAVAIMRFADQTVQDPRIADRPKWAENPLGRIVYGITSFIYSFQDKVLKGMARKVGREYNISKELGASKPKAALDATTYVAATVAPTMLTLFTGHFIFSTLREMIFNQDKWDREWEENNNDPIAFATDYIIPLAFARSGFTGAFDPLYQMYKGLKYRRDFSNTLIGTGGYVSQNMESITEFFINNSENTLTNEYNALKGLWNITINPFLSRLYAMTPMSPPTALVGAPILMHLTSEDFKNARINDFLELIYGERYQRGKRGRPSQDYKGITK